MYLRRDDDHYDDEYDDYDEYDEVSLHGVTVGEAAGLRMVCTEGSAHLLLEPDYQNHHADNHDGKW